MTYGADTQHNSLWCSHNFIDMRGHFCQSSTSSTTQSSYTTLATCEAACDAAGTSSCTAFSFPNDGTPTTPSAAHECDGSPPGASSYLSSDACTSTDQCTFYVGCVWSTTQNDPMTSEFWKKVWDNNVARVPDASLNE